jgi:hypothetical protein
MLMYVRDNVSTNAIPYAVLILPLFFKELDLPRDLRFVPLIRPLYVATQH